MEKNTNPQESIIPVLIEKEISTSYLNYAMSVIVSRALPDVRDGLKPVHRRILYSMSAMGLAAGSQYKKTGRIVGDVLGKYHPHGDQSIYDALVRLAQDFSVRYPLVDGQGNFGSLDGDPPAAMRYTEARMTHLAEEMLRDIQKETVDFRPNYDDSMQEPSVLPGAFPFLLANGGTGIAVGMTTSLPPHNLREVAAAIKAYIHNPHITTEELCTHIQGPDFPTGGIIQGVNGIIQTYTTGKGQIVVRGTLEVEPGTRGRKKIVVREIPYLISKSAILTRIADVVNAQKITGIHSVRDESDRNGTRIVLELKPNTDPQLVCTRLYALTQLQSNFNSNLLAIVNGKPKILSLKEMIECFVLHRKEVITRRTQHDLRVSEARKHIVEGLIIAIDNIDEVIRIIRKSKDVASAQHNLINAFALSEKQAKAILEMRLQKLTNLEVNKLQKELEGLIAFIAYLNDLLAHEQKILDLIADETQKISQQYGDERRTRILQQESEKLDQTQMIQPSNVVLLLSHVGYIKRTPLTSYRAQARGGRGSASAIGVENDWLQNIQAASTINRVLFVSDKGKCYTVLINDIEDLSRSARGKHLRSIIGVGEAEHISEMLVVKDFSAKSFILFATQRGVLKRTAISEYSNIKTRGVLGIKLDKNDTLCSASLVDGTEQIVLITANGQGLCIGNRSIRPMGRSSRGNQGIKLNQNDQLIASCPVLANTFLLLLTEQGFAKLLSFSSLQQHGRGTKGQRVYTTSDSTGAVMAALTVQKDWKIFIASSAGNVTVVPIAEIPVQGRTARGVRCMHINKEEKVVAATPIFIN